MSDRAEAGTPSVDFAVGIDVDGDGQNDCGTGVPLAVGDGAPDAVAVEVANTTCNAAADAKLDVRVYLMNNGGITYAGVGTQVEYTGVTSLGPGQAVWRGCVFAAVFSAVVMPPTPGIENVGCAIGLYPAYPVTNLGVVAVFRFSCAASGTIAIGSDVGETALVDNSLIDYRDPGIDQLTINCEAAGATPPPPLAGDSNCDGRVTSIDATLILQRHAGLIDSLPCASAADVNADGMVDARDAALVLQYEAGLVHQL